MVLLFAAKKGKIEVVQYKVGWQGCKPVRFNAPHTFPIGNVAVRRAEKGITHDIHTILYYKFTLSLHGAKKVGSLNINKYLMNIFAIFLTNVSKMVTNASISLTNGSGKVCAHADDADLSR